jgi:dihydrofolate synthase / folylpolyglutamate synthase
MIVTPVKTRAVKVGDHLYTILDEYLPAIPNPVIVAISSKVVALCERAVIPVKGTDRRELIKKEADYYLAPNPANYNYTVTIKNNAFVAAAGIDYGAGNHILWPRDPQLSANNLRRHLTKTFGIAIGVIITDSRSLPLRRGTTGFALAHSGFAALRNYIGKRDVFDEEIYFKVANVLDGLSAAAVTAMGDGNEQTPIAVISDVPGVEFQARNPSPKELAEYYIRPDDDLYRALLDNVPWDKKPS